MTDAIKFTISSLLVLIFCAALTDEDGNTHSLVEFLGILSALCLVGGFIWIIWAF